MKTKYIWLLTILLSGTLVFAVVLTYALRTAGHNVTIDVSVPSAGQTVREISFDGFSLNVGESCGYTLNVSAEVESFYNVGFSFVRESGDGLEDFVEVEITHDDVVRSASLKDLFRSDGSLSFDLVLSSSPQTFVVTFSIPREYGNEVAGKFLDFTLLLYSKG